jgi:hypothetical protein
MEVKKRHVGHCIRDSFAKSAAWCRSGEYIGCSDGPGRVRFGKTENLVNCGRMVVLSRAIVVCLVAGHARGALAEGRVALVDTDCLANVKWALLPVYCRRSRSGVTNLQLKQHALTSGLGLRNNNNH